MKLIELSEKECNEILDDINYDGLRGQGNYNALRLVLTYLAKLSDMKVDVFLQRVLNNAMYTEICYMYNASPTRMRECYEITRGRLEEDYAEVIKEGVYLYKFTSNLLLARLCFLCNYSINYCPEGSSDSLTPLLCLTPKIKSKKIIDFLLSRDLSNCIQMRNYIISKGKGWHKSIGVNQNCIRDFELLLGIDWRENNSRIFDSRFYETVK